jgi:hypothetical protein
MQTTQTGGSGRAEGFAHGDWADHRQSFDRLRRDAALAAATGVLALADVRKMMIR